MSRFARLTLSVLVVSVLLVATAGASSARDAGSGATYMKVKGAKAAKPHGGGTLLFSHGGAVETPPKVFIVYWGAQWQTGFTTGGYTSAQAQSYVEGFFGGVGGSSWANSDTQYCQGVPSGTTVCPASAAHVTNPSGQLGGTWNDTSPVPSSPTQSQIAAEAAAAAAHFGYNSSANYMVFTPTGNSSSGFGTRWCAYHSSTSSSSGTVAYTYMPYVPDAGASCGMNFVNGSDSFGHGYFDGFSIVGGHEYAEAATDPFPNSGWLDGSGAENGDKCAWISSGQGASTNITLGSNYYAVQSLWSNAFNGGAGGCVISYP
jgi:serine protease